MGFNGLGRPRAPRTTQGPANAAYAEFADNLLAIAAVGVKPIEDVQGRADARGIPIDKVGIKDLLHPVTVRDPVRGEQHTIASLSMSVNLPQDAKGTHMSRFVEILGRQVTGISIDTFAAMLQETTRHLKASAAQIEMTFPYFVMKTAPVSGVRSLMDYRAAVFGEHRDAKTQVWLRVTVPVTSLCPCSKQISSYGAHNQRSHITITARIAGPLWSQSLWFEDLIGLAEAVAACELYAILKRPDEKYVTERAYDNAKFVEDVVRDAAVALNRDPRVRAYVVESENFESIHNHSAYAKIEFTKAHAPASRVEPFADLADD